MTIFVSAHIGEIRVWRDDDGWHSDDPFGRWAVESTLAGASFDMAYFPDLPRAELLVLQHAFGALLTVDYLEPIPEYDPELTY